MRACILGCSGHKLSAEERAFFADADPWGFVVFARNVDTPEQLSALTRDLRETVGRDAPIFVDQEGGRVQRLKPPHWRAIPPAEVFGRLYCEHADAGLEAAALNHRLIAHELRAVGLDADCTPCADLAVKGADKIIGDRAFSSDPADIAALSRAALDGLAQGGVIGVIKHLPGHGRAGVDSHLRLPIVAETAAALASDIAAFAPLADAPCAMTAHVVYPAWDAEAPATMSKRVITEIIRGAIGFDGLLMSDDLSMKALKGPMKARAANTLAAGCDITLHCNGDMAEMKAVVEGSKALAGQALARAKRAEAFRSPPGPFDPSAARAALDALLAPVMRGAGA